MCRALVLAGVDALPAAPPWHVQGARSFFFLPVTMHFALLRQRHAHGWFFFGRRCRKWHGFMVSSASQFRSTFRLRLLFSGVHFHSRSHVFCACSSRSGRLKDVLNLWTDSSGAFRGFFSECILARLSVRHVQYFSTYHLSYFGAPFSKTVITTVTGLVYRTDLFDQVLGACHGQFQFSERPFPNRVLFTVYRDHVSEINRGRRRCVQGRHQASRNARDMAKEEGVQATHGPRIARSRVKAKKSKENERGGPRTTRGEPLRG